MSSSLLTNCFPCQPCYFTLRLWILVNILTLHGFQSQRVTKISTLNTWWKARVLQRIANSHCRYSPRIKIRQLIVFVDGESFLASYILRTQCKKFCIFTVSLNRNNSGGKQIFCVLRNSLFSAYALRSILVFCHLGMKYRISSNLIVAGTNIMGSKCHSIRSKATCALCLLNYSKVVAYLCTYNVTKLEGCLQFFLFIWWSLQSYNNAIIWRDISMSTYFHSFVAFIWNYGRMFKIQQKW